MDSETIQLLNQLNQQFYQTVASSFDATRATPWQGWEIMMPYLRQLETWRVLDLGCGNGRFGVFLSKQVDLPISYVGVDSNPYLLERAAEALSSQPLSYRLIEADIVQDNKLELEQTFDLIVLFGVIHHVPSFELRQKVIHQASSWLAPTGRLAISFWNFYEQERFRKRIIPWDSEIVPTKYRHLDLELHDYLLDWKRDTTEVVLRYCHYVDEEERKNLLTGMRLFNAFEADTGNYYVIFNRLK